MYLSNHRTSIIFGHLNVNSIRNKILLISDFLHEHNIDIFCMTETKVDSDTKIMNIPGYEIIRRDRTGSGGGVAIIHKSYLSHKYLKTETLINDESKIELLSCKFQVGMRKSFIVSVLYRPKFNLTKNDIDCFDSIIFEHVQYKCKFYICGDYNIHLENIKLPNIKNFNKLLYRHNLRELVQNPTRQGARLDLIVTNDNDTHISAMTCQPLISDHDATLINKPIYRPQRLPKTKICFRNFTNMDMISLGNEVGQLRFDGLKFLTVTDACQVLLTQHLQLFDKYAPIQNRSTRSTREMSLHLCLYLRKVSRNYETPSTHIKRPTRHT